MNTVFWRLLIKLFVLDPFHIIQEFEKEHPTEANIKGLDKLKLEDLEAQMEILTEMDKKYCSQGPSYDCVVFNDGEIWRYEL